MGLSYRIWVWVICALLVGVSLCARSAAAQECVTRARSIGVPLGGDAASSACLESWALERVARMGRAHEAANGSWGKLACAMDLARAEPSALAPPVPRDGLRYRDMANRRAARGTSASTRPCAVLCSGCPAERGGPARHKCQHPALRGVV